MSEKVGHDSSSAIESPKTNLEKVGHDSFSAYDAPNAKVEFEDYLYFAAIQRREEDLATMPRSEKVEKSSWFNRLSEHKGPNVNINLDAIENPAPPTADELERETASRALRLASWASVFYLITTDILGPFNAPFAISQTGWVPGTKFQLFLDILSNINLLRHHSLRCQYVILLSLTEHGAIIVLVGILAGYTGLILWRLFVRLDSVRHPLKTYGDIAERIFGIAARHVCTVLQSIQLLVNVRPSVCPLLFPAYHLRIKIGCNHLFG